MHSGERPFMVLFDTLDTRTIIKARNARDAIRGARRQLPRENGFRSHKAVACEYRGGAFVGPVPDAFERVMLERWKTARCLKAPPVAS